MGPKCVPFKMIPEILNNVHIGGIRAPWRHIDVLELKPACCMLGCVLHVMVMLEIDAVTVQIMVIEGAQEVFGEDIDIHEPVHDTIDR